MALYSFQVLDGDRMAESLYKINFREDIKSRDLCTLKLNYNDVEKLRNAIEDLYYFEFVLDDLPVRGFIGQLEEQLMPGTSTTYLWTHMHFALQYNGDQIVVANVTEKMHEVCAMITCFRLRRFHLSICCIVNADGFHIYVDSCSAVARTVCGRATGLNQAL